MANPAPVKTSANCEPLKKLIREVPDFPNPGIVFKDVTPLLANAALFRRATAGLAAPFQGEGIETFRHSPQ